MVLTDVRVDPAAQQKSLQHKCAAPNTVGYYILSTMTFTPHNSVSLTLQVTAHALDSSVTHRHMGKSSKTFNDNNNYK